MKVSCSELVKSFGQVLMSLSGEHTIITHHGREVAILMSIEEYNKLANIPENETRYEKVRKVPDSPLSSLTNLLGYTVKEANKIIKTNILTMDIDNIYADAIRLVRYFNIAAQYNLQIQVAAIEWVNCPNDVFDMDMCDRLINFEKSIIECELNNISNDNFEVVCNNIKSYFPRVYEYLFDILKYKREI
jgi:prevent-host-death family protein